MPLDFSIRGFKLSSRSSPRADDSPPAAKWDALPHVHVKSGERGMGSYHDMEAPLSYNIPVTASSNASPFSTNGSAASTVATHFSPSLINATFPTQAPIPSTASAAVAAILARIASGRFANTSGINQASSAFHIDSALPSHPIFSSSSSVPSSTSIELQQHQQYHHHHQQQQQHPHHDNNFNDSFQHYQRQGSSNKRGGISGSGGGSGEKEGLIYGSNLSPRARPVSSLSNHFGSNTSLTTSGGAPNPNNNAPVHTMHYTRQRSAQATSKPISTPAIPASYSNDVSHIIMSSSSSGSNASSHIIGSNSNNNSTSLSTPHPSTPHPSSPFSRDSSAHSFDPALTSGSLSYATAGKLGLGRGGALVDMNLPPVAPLPASPLHVSIPGMTSSSTLLCHSSSSSSFCEPDSCMASAGSSVRSRSGSGSGSGSMTSSGCSSSLGIMSAMGSMTNNNNSSSNNGIFPNHLAAVAAKDYPSHQYHSAHSSNQPFYELSEGSAVNPKKTTPFLSSMSTDLLKPPAKGVANLPSGNVSVSPPPSFEKEKKDFSPGGDGNSSVNTNVRNTGPGISNPGQVINHNSIHNNHNSNNIKDNPSCFEALILDMDSGPLRNVLVSVSSNSASFAERNLDVSTRMISHDRQDEVARKIGEGACVGGGSDETGRDKRRRRGGAEGGGEKEGEEEGGGEEEEEEADGGGEEKEEAEEKGVKKRDEGDEEKREEQEKGEEQDNDNSDNNGINSDNDGINSDNDDGDNGDDGEECQSEIGIESCEGITEREDVEKGGKRDPRSFTGERGEKATRKEGGGKGGKKKLRASKESSSFAITRSKSLTRIPRKRRSRRAPEEAARNEKEVINMGVEVRREGKGAEGSEAQGMANAKEMTMTMVADGKEKRERRAGAERGKVEKNPSNASRGQTSFASPPIASPPIASPPIASILSSSVASPLHSEAQKNRDATARKRVAAISHAYGTSTTGSYHSYSSPFSPSLPSPSPSSPSPSPPPVPLQNNPEVGHAGEGLYPKGKQPPVQLQAYSKFPLPKFPANTSHAQASTNGTTSQGIDSTATQGRGGGGESAVQLSGMPLSLSARALSVARNSEVRNSSTKNSEIKNSELDPSRAVASPSCTTMSRSASSNLARTTSCGRGSTSAGSREGRRSRNGGNAERRDGGGGGGENDPQDIADEANRKAQERLEAFKKAEMLKAKAADAATQEQRSKRHEGRELAKQAKDRRRIEIYALNALLHISDEIKAQQYLTAREMAVKSKSEMLAERQKSKTLCEALDQSAEAVLSASVTADGLAALIPNSGPLIRI